MKLKVYRATALLCALVFTGLAVLLFNMRKVTGDPSFMIRDLSWWFWFGLAAAAAATVFFFKKAGISRGYILLTVMSLVWLFPVVWILLTSFRQEQGFYSASFFPEGYTFLNYKNLFGDTAVFNFARWYRNTLLVAACSCLLTTFIVLSTSYVLSRLRFRGRRLFMNLLLILGMFPGFMSMIAVYYIIKGMGLSQTLAALVLCYSGGSALGYYIVKGYFDTIPRSLDEAAVIDGATRLVIYTRIIIPLSKPIIIYTILTSFIAPWADFIFARIILGDKADNYTVAVGLFTMLDPRYIEQWYTRFTAGAVLVALPIAVLFIALKKYYVESLSGSVKG
jgi:arabinogalactan oligomer/maltooligosaccharide transport system permease protein